MTQIKSIYTTEKIYFYLVNLSNRKINLMFSPNSASSFFQFYPYSLEFKKPAQTSRDTLYFKRGLFISLTWNEFTAWGEVSVIDSLSIDNVGRILLLLKKWQESAKNFTHIADWFQFIDEDDLSELPALITGLEMVKYNMANQSHLLYFPSPFTHGSMSIPINGLVWMGSYGEMQKQIDAKLSEGFTCIKLKIGAISWEDEYRLLSSLRNRYSADQLEIRVDANGAFTQTNVFSVMEQLHRLHIHSIEQPVAVNQWELMHEVVALRAVPVALDEELIGKHTDYEMTKLLDAIRPDYVILKPSLIGGFSRSDQWILHAQKRNIKWWATSALESNLGLNALSQWAASRGPEITHGLGTGSLYKQNVDSPLQILNARLIHHPFWSGNIRDGIIPLVDQHFAI